MSRTFLIVLSLLVVFPPAASAQRWTPAEQEIVTLSKKCWDAWAETVNKRNLGIWLETCKPSEDLAGWWTTDGALWTLEADKRSFDQLVRGAFHFGWENLQPLEIRIYGDVALFWVYVTYGQEDASGKRTRYEDKRFEVFRRLDGTWRWTGAMVSGRVIGAFVEEPKWVMKLGRSHGAAAVSEMQ